MKASEQFMFRSFFVQLRKILQIEYCYSETMRYSWPLAQGKLDGKGASLAGF